MRLKKKLMKKPKMRPMTMVTESLMVNWIPNSKPTMTAMVNLMVMTRLRTRLMRKLKKTPRMKGLENSTARN